MARALSIEPSFLTDVEREPSLAQDGPARRFLRREPAAELALATVALGELAEGYGDAGHPALSAIRRSRVCRALVRAWVLVMSFFKQKTAYEIVM